METIGTRVKALRLGLRLSQTELAKRVEIAQPSLTNIEKGRTKEVKGYVLDALARELNTTTGYLLSGAKNSQDHESTMMQAELMAIFSKLPEADQTALLRSARGMLRQHQQGSNINPFPRMPYPPSLSPP